MDDDDLAQLLDRLAELLADDKARHAEIEALVVAIRQEQKRRRGEDNGGTVIELRPDGWGDGD